MIPDNRARAVERRALHGSGGPPEPAVASEVQRFRDRLERMRRANELLTKWRPNQAAPALEQLGFPRSTVARLISPAVEGHYGFTDAEIAEAEAEFIKALRQETTGIIRAVE